MLINVRCCIDWSTRKIILTLGRYENILYLTILNDMVFVKRCLTLTLSALRFSGFSFEAGGRTHRPIVSHSTSGTLIPIFGSFTFTVHFHSIFYFLKRT